MSKRRQADRQWTLFEKSLAWHGLPEDVHERLIRLFAAMCVEIVDQLQPRPESKEQSDERTED